MTTNTNSTLRDEVLASISAIDEAVIESDMSVTLALMDASDKAMMIMENYTGDDVDAFTFFQEASKWDPKHPFKEDNALMTIVKFIPNLIRLIIKKLGDLFGIDKRSNLEKIADGFKAVASTGSELFAALSDVINGNEKKVVVGGIVITSAAVGVATGAFRKAAQAVHNYAHGSGAKTQENLEKDKAMKFNKDGTVSTTIKFDALSAWTVKLLKRMEDYLAGIQSINNFKGDDDITKITATMPKFDDLISEFNKSTKFTSAIPKNMSIGEFVAAYSNIDNLVNGKRDEDGNVTEKGIKQKYSEIETWTKDIKKLDPEVSKNNKVLQNMGAQVSRDIQAASSIIVSISSVVDAHAGVWKKIQEAVANVAADNEVPTSGGFTAIIVGLVKKIKAGASALAAKFKKDAGGNEGGTNPNPTDETSSTPKPADETPTDETPDDKINESYVDDSDDEVVLESVEYTKDLQTIEKTAKTVDEVNKLKAETFSSVKNVKYKAGKKALIIEGYSKIKHDTGKIKELKGNETWDDVDMSAHDRRDPVRLIITGPGAEAYAESKKGGKKVVEECGDAGCSPKTVTESPDTSWYYTR